MFSIFFGEPLKITHFCKTLIHVPYYNIEKLDQALGLSEEANKIFLQSDYKFA